MANGKALRFVAVEVDPSSSRTLPTSEVRCAEGVLAVSYLEVLVGDVVIADQSQTVCTDCDRCVVTHVVCRIDRGGRCSRAVSV